MLTVTHATVATFPDEPGAEINRQQWNEDHQISGTIEQSQNNVATDGVTITGDGTPGSPISLIPGAGDVDSVFGRTGNVTAQSGDYNTSQVTENTNLYFTDERAQDAVGGMVNGTLTYVDATPSLGINLSNANTWAATQTFSQVNTPIVQATTSAGGELRTNSGASAAQWGAGGSANGTLYGGWNYDNATANTIASFGASKTITSLSTATYPNLTELSYVKGVTSAIQTQLNGKQATITPAALTEVDDTNVTLTLGGTPATALLQAVSITAGWTGTLAVARGGSGASTAQGAMNTFAGAVTSGSYLRGNGTNVVMSTIQAADVPTLNQNTTGSAATLTTPRAIGINGSTGLTATGVNFNGSAAINMTLGGTLIAANGGTGQSSYAVGDILYASTTTALSKLAGVATGNALISGGVGVAPAWGKIGLTTHVSGTLPVANGGTGVTTATGTTSVVLSDSPALTGTPTAPTAAAGTSTTQLATTAFVTAGKVVVGTPVATTSGATVTLSTTIPSTAKKITLCFNAVSTTGTSPWLVQIGPSGGAETSGYAGASTYIQSVSPYAGVSTSTAGFVIGIGTSVASVNGIMEINLMDATNNRWASSHTVGDGTNSLVFTGGSTKALAGTLTQIRITTVGGSDTFDAGSISVNYL